MSDSLRARLDDAFQGRYRTLERLGEGGMAFVFLAEDLRHARRVAIKVLKPELAAVVGAERFLAEIETTAGLQHPHILPLFDSGESDGLLWYVMPFVAGESLADRLERERQLPMQAAVSITRKIAGALQAAHERGVIHRDIKPGNILLQDGEPVLADFGIALAVARAGAGRLTETGLSVGTPWYMSPEQATGDHPPDHRSDQYSLAAVCYEMLAGEPPFSGSSTQAVISKLLTQDPAPVSEHRRRVPPGIEDALDRALSRLPADRFERISDFAEALGAGLEEGTAARFRVGRRGGSAPGFRSRLPWLAAGVAAVLAAVAWLRPAPSGLLDIPPSHLAIPIPNLGGAATAVDRQIGITPDGSTLFYSAIAPDGENRTMRRRLHEVESTVVPGVVSFLTGYSISPDGSKLMGGVRSSGRGYMYDIDGGNERLLPDELAGTQIESSAWDGDGNVWFTSDAVTAGLVRMDPSGEVTRPFGDRFGGFVVNQILPDGHTALAVSAPRGVSSGPVLLVDLRNGEVSEPILEDVSGVRYTAGYLVYALPTGDLLAVEFDPETREVGRRPVVLASGVTVEAGNSQYAVSQNGTVAYIPEEPRTLIFRDRNGRIREASRENHSYHAPSFSPDGSRVAVDFTGEEGRNVWVLSVDDGVPTRATFDPGGHDARWTPDGELIYLAESGGAERIGLFRTRPGNVDSDSLNALPFLNYTGHMLSDGSAIITTADGFAGESQGDLVRLEDGGRGEARGVVATRFAETSVSLSPDNRWIAYASNRSGRSEVYVQALDGTGDQVQVSLGGGIEPVWSPRGDEVFYRSGAGRGSVLIAAGIETTPRPRVVSREELFPVDDIATATPHQNYDVSPDGQTFVMVRFNPASRIMLIQNLPALIETMTGG